MSISQKPSRIKAAHRRYHILSLGCAKNTVDSQGMATLLERDGWRATGDPRRADLLIVNTCGLHRPGAGGVADGVA
jgi:tRNA A37 methylthiotransferase MiaB